jgi:hypothetical protein
LKVINKALNEGCAELIIFSLKRAMSNWPDWAAWAWLGSWPGWAEHLCSRLSICDVEFLTFCFQSSYSFLIQNKYCSMDEWYQINQNHNCSLSKSMKLDKFCKYDMKVLGARKLTGENLKVVLAEFSTLGQAVLQIVYNSWPIQKRLSLDL